MHHKMKTRSLILIVVFLIMRVGVMYGQKLINSEAFKQGISKGNIQLIDVRTYGEYRAGHIQNALLIDWYKQAAFIKGVTSLDKSKAVYVYCQAGVRSSKAAKQLTKMGFEAYDLKGGYGAWRPGR